MNRLRLLARSLFLVSISVLSVKPAMAQSQTPGQITQFGPNLNVVDSVITQDSNANIGIGATAPAAKLDVVGGNLNLENSSATSGNILKSGVPFLHNNPGLIPSSASMRATSTDGSVPGRDQRQTRRLMAKESDGIRPRPGAIDHDELVSRRSCDSGGRQQWDSSAGGGIGIETAPVYLGTVGSHVSY
jgi:hypothetical protein